MDLCSDSIIETYVPSDDTYSAITPTVNKIIVPTVSITDF